MDAATALAKALGKAAMPALKTLVLKREDVVGFLRRHGYTAHDDKFAVEYVHALVMRDEAGARKAMLDILRDRDVIAALAQAWPAGLLSDFIAKVKWAVDSLAPGDEVRRQAIDVEREAKAFWDAFRQAVAETRPPSKQEEHAVALDTNEAAADTNRELKELRGELAAKENERELTGAALLEGYLQDVVVATERIDIQGIGSAPGAGHEALSFGIEENYTPLTTAQSFREGKADGLAFERPERTVLTDLLSKQRRLLIVGDPGSGKTTFLKLIACVLAKDGLDANAAGRATHLGLALDRPAMTPVFIRISSLAATLKECHGVGDPGAAWNCLLRTMERTYDAPTAALLAALLAEGKAALLLDGLDEVADPQRRKEIVNVVNSVLHHWRRNLVVITSRQFGFREVAALEDVATAHIDDFGDEEISEFLERWASAMYAGAEGKRKDAYLPSLKSAVLNVPTIRRMARNPVMLTCLCVVHWNERQLPEGKADLLAAVLRWLLAAKEDKRQERGYDSNFAGECFKALALAMTAPPEGKQASADLGWAAEAMAVPFHDERDISDRRLRSEGSQFLDAEMIDSGIVVQDGLGQVRFWHLTFQEHYAARALAELPDHDRGGGWWCTVEPHLHDPQWGEVLDHFAGCLAKMGRRGLHLLVERVLGLARPNDLESTARAAGALGRLLYILRVYGYSPPARYEWDDVRKRVMDIFTPEGAAEVPAPERIRAAEALGQGGDERFRGFEPTMLPIPGLPGVELGKYPVTVQEYARFVENGGYSEEALWGEWWGKKEWDLPEDWEEQLEHRNRPVTGVSWYEATAYCRCLAAQMGDDYRLATDDEWERAATNPDGDYPWGEAEPSEELCNFGYNVGCATPVGVYPAGAAPGGHLDMAGNVWEWCEGLYGKEGSVRVNRGGSWHDSAGYCRSANRFAAPPGNRNDNLGFRLSRSVP